MKIRQPTAPWLLERRTVGTAQGVKPLSPGPRTRRAWALCFGCSIWAYGCSSALPATNEANVPESSCEQYLEVLRTDKQAGLSCSTSKQHAERADPECKLIYNCKDPGHTSSVR